MGIYVEVCVFISLGNFWNGIGGLYGKHIFDLMFNCYHIFQSSSPILNAHQQYMSSGSSISSLTFGIGSLFSFSHSSECVSSVQFSRSVVSDSLRPQNHSTPGLPVHHQLPESTQTHVH